MPIFCRFVPRRQIATISSGAEISKPSTVTGIPSTSVSNGTARLSPIIVANPIRCSYSSCASTMASLINALSWAGLGGQRRSTASARRVGAPPAVCLGERRFELFFILRTQGPHCEGSPFSHRRRADQAKNLVGPLTAVGEKCGWGLRGPRRSPRMSDMLRSALRLDIIL